MRLLIFVALAFPADAFAFCRTTTCKGEKCARDADGCPSEGVPIAWKSSCVPFYIQSDLSDLLEPNGTRDAINRAFAAWDAVDCGGGKTASLTFIPQDQVACKRSEYRDGGPNVNVVIFQDDHWEYKDTDNTLAKTLVTFNPSTGEILDADIEVNTAGNAVTIGGNTRVKYDLQSILTHEVGHFIGLAHSNNSFATMYASYEPGTTELRSLDPDDVAAVCAAYPPDRQAVCDPEPLGGPANACDQRVDGCNTASGLPILAVIVALILRRRSAFFFLLLTTCGQATAVQEGCKEPGHNSRCLCKDGGEGVRTCQEDGSYTECTSCRPIDVQSPVTGQPPAPAQRPSSVNNDTDTCPGKLIGLKPSEAKVESGETTSAAGNYDGTCSSASGKDGVYEIIPTANGLITARLQGKGAFDAVLYVREGTCRDGQELACEDKSTVAGLETLSFNAVKGNSYFVFVDGKGTTSGGYEVKFELAEGSFCGDGTVDTNEACDDANLDANDGCSTSCQPEGDPLGYGRCPGMPVHLWGTERVYFYGNTTPYALSYEDALCGGRTSQDRVFAVTSHTGGMLVVQATATFNIALYLRANCEAEQAIECANVNGVSSGADAFNETLSHYINAGVTYYLVVDGGSVAQFGYFAMDFTVTP